MVRIQWVRLALVALVVAAPASAFAQPTKAGVVTTVRGTATVSRASLSQPVPLKFKDDVFAQDRVSTGDEDRKSTRLNSSHSQISYAVFCLKKKKKMTTLSVEPPGLAHRTMHVVVRQRVTA